MNHSSRPIPYIEERKSVLITGCSSGIGHATAIYLAKAGFTVFATVRKEKDQSSLLELHEPNLIPICPLDLTKLEQISSVVHQVADEIQQRGQTGLYALIHNAGGGGVAPVELMNLQHFEIELRTRLVGAVGLTQACLPLIRQGHGRIVWISTPAVIPTPYVASIHACDFAVNCVARTLDLELKPWQIPNILIRCGGIKTETGLRTTDGVEDLLKDASRDRTPLYRQVLQKWGNDMAAFDEKRTDPDEVASVILKALRAPRPKNRYAIGYMAGMAALLESLPQPVADGILKMRF